jgi:hypothetical protein
MGLISEIFGAVVVATMMVAALASSASVGGGAVLIIIFRRDKRALDLPCPSIPVVAAARLLSSFLPFLPSFLAEARAPWFR